MKQMITIAPIEQFEKGFSTYLDGKYTLPGEGIINILTDGRVVLRECEGNEATKKLWFDDQRPDHTLTFDDENKSQLAEANAWRRHPQVNCPDYNHEGDQYRFRLIDKLAEIYSDIKRVKQQGIVFNMINNTTIEEMRNIGFYVGIPNAGLLPPEELYLELVDFSDGPGGFPRGVLMRDPEDFLNRYRNPDLECIVVVEKAIALGVFEHKEGMYFVNNQVAGKNTEDLVIYCKNNKEMYENFIRKEVSQRDDFPISEKYMDRTVKEYIKIEGRADDVEEELLLEDVVEDTAEKPATLQQEAKQSKEEKKPTESKSKKKRGRKPTAHPPELKAKAKELGIRGYAMMSTKQLKARIDEEQKAVPA